jgi:energy-coupling factor transporter transmembrane protein EcfT
VSTLIAQMDQRASSGRTIWHRSGALGKLLLAAAVIGLALASPSLTLLVSVHALAWLLVATSGLPPRVVAAAAGYPLLFLTLFLVARWDGTLATPLALVLRPLTASLTAVWLLGTTPYPDVFAPLSRVLPRGAGDGLFLTYRALFALLTRAEWLRMSLRLRGGMSGPLRRRLAVVGEGLGTLVVHGFERSRHLYSAMLLRGHSGRVCGCRHFARRSVADLGVIGVALALATAAVLLWKAP